MNEAQYIEHEVQMRVMKETTESKFVMMQKNFDDRFSSFEKRMDDRFTHIDYKINLIIGIMVVSLLVPLIKTALGMLSCTTKNMMKLFTTKFTRKVNTMNGSRLISKSAREICRSIADEPNRSPA